MNHAPNEPILRMHCQRRRQGLLISGPDYRLLQLLAERDISVSLVTSDGKAYTARVNTLLRHARLVAGQDAWFVGITGLLWEVAPSLVPSFGRG